MIQHLKRLLVSIGYIGCALLTISLVTYSSRDYSFLYGTSNTNVYTNALGWVGASGAGILFYLLGMSALLLPVLFCLMLFYADEWHKQRVRIASCGVMIPLCAALLHSLSYEFFSLVYPGGALGALIYHSILIFLDPVPATLLLAVGLWILIVLTVQYALLPYVYGAVRLAAQLPWYKVKLLMIDIYAWASHQIYQGYLQLFDVIQEEPEEVAQIFADPIWDNTVQPAHEILQKKIERKKRAPKAPRAELESESSETENEGVVYALPKKEAGSQKQSIADELAIEKESKLRAQMLEQKLEHFGIHGSVVTITHGPVVTLFEYQPGIDTKISTILAREDDLALALQAHSLRIIAPIPGKSVIGFEVAHTHRKAVLFNQLIMSDQFQHSGAKLPLVLGKDTLGKDVIIDLASLPHVLVAGSTGSGKSVCLNALIMSLLYSKSPDELLLILIDPKRLEFSAYADIAHLCFPVVTDPVRALIALKWAVKTMEQRYITMSQKGVRNIHEYHTLKDVEVPMPFIVIIIDELADLMMTGGKDVEYAIARLAQMARAAGIHLIIATQRPSVDVITGLIKVNFPSRIAFKVTSKVDSRTILDTMGAEKLLGKGDMLFLDPRGVMNRIHGAYVTDAEIQAVVSHIKSQRTVCYQELSVVNPDQASEEADQLLQEVVGFIEKRDEISISLIQRIFRIGYNRSARIIEQLEARGHILPSDGSKMRKVAKRA